MPEEQASRTVYAFRCNACGRLHTSGDAAEAAHPHACRVCGGGVSFDPRSGARTVDDGNWEVLADASDERLADLGVSRDDVGAHEPWKVGETAEARAPRRVEAGASDGPKSADR